jgi:hypothetical protein
MISPACRSGSVRLLHAGRIAPHARAAIFAKELRCIGAGGSVLDDE